MSLVLHTDFTYLSSDLHTWAYAGLFGKSRSLKSKELKTHSNGVYNLQELSTLIFTYSCYVVSPISWKQQYGTSFFSCNAAGVYKWNLLHSEFHQLSEVSNSNPTPLSPFSVFSSYRWKFWAFRVAGSCTSGEETNKEVCNDTVLEYQPIGDDLLAKTPEGDRKRGSPRKTRCRGDSHIARESLQTVVTCPGGQRDGWWETWPSGRCDQARKWAKGWGAYPTESMQDRLLLHSPKADNFRVTWETRDKNEIFHFSYKPGLLSSILLHEILNQWR